jgi:predicted amidophosphoribosyltransferase
MLQQAITLLSDAFEVLVPKECLVCRRPLRRHSLCFRCTPALPALTGTLKVSCTRCFGPLAALTSNGNNTCHSCILYQPVYNQMRFIWNYAGLARDFIRAMKYRPSVVLARQGGAWLSDALPELFAAHSWDLVIPIPSSQKTFKKRLFNPCDEMAEEIMKLLPSSQMARLLVHDRRRTPQASRSHEDRLRGLKKLFHARSHPRLEGARVLLVEDVITTGATISAACHTLRQAGAQSVDVIALARTQVWSRFRSRLHEAFPPPFHADS